MKFYKESEKAELELVKQFPSAYMVFRVLARNMDDYNAVVISMAALAEIVGMSTKSIGRAIKYLKENKYIAVINSGRTNVYHLNTSIVAVKADTKGCKFSCTVVLSKKELNLNKGFYDIK